MIFRKSDVIGLERRQTTAESTKAYKQDEFYEVFLSVCKFAYVGKVLLGMS